MVQWVVVGIFGLATALATGLGAIPFVFLRNLSPRAVAVSTALAAGLMLGASFGLVAEGTAHGSWETLVGAVAGVAFILVAQRMLEGHNLDIGSVHDADSRRMALMVIVMTIHSFSEGVAVGVSFGGSVTLASVITLAIAVHNIPEGLAISAVLRSRGVPVWKCAGWSVFSSLPQPLMAVPAFLFVDSFRPTLPYGIGFAAGAMVFMVLAELLPETYETERKATVALLVSLTLVGMVLFQRAIG